MREEETPMIDEDSGDIEHVLLSVHSDDFRVLQRAAALAQTDLNSYVIQAAVNAAASVIATPGRLNLSERDSIRVIELLENPPEPIERMIAAARALPSAPRLLRFGTNLHHHLQETMLN
jgi:uncharacterized protein (DUF1778 family)